MFFFSFPLTGVYEAPCLVIFHLRCSRVRY